MERKNERLRKWNEGRKKDCLEEKTKKEKDRKEKERRLMTLHKNTEKLKKKMLIEWK